MIELYLPLFGETETNTLNHGYGCIKSNPKANRRSNYEKFSKDLFSQIEKKRKILQGLIFVNQLKCKEHAGIICAVRSKQINVLIHDISSDNNSPGTSRYNYQNLDMIYMIYSS